MGVDLYVFGNPALTSLELGPALSSVGGDLYVSSNRALPSLELPPALSTVGGNLYVSYNEALITLDMRGLVEVVGTFTVSTNSPASRQRSLARSSTSRSSLPQETRCTGMRTQPFVTLAGLLSDTMAHAASAWSLERLWAVLATEGPERASDVMLQALRYCYRGSCSLLAILVQTLKKAPQSQTSSSARASSAATVATTLHL